MTSIVDWIDAKRDNETVVALAASAANVSPQQIRRRVVGDLNVVIVFLRLGH